MCKIDSSFLPGLEFYELTPFSTRMVYFLILLILGRLQPFPSLWLHFMALNMSFLRFNIKASQKPHILRISPVF